MQCGFRRWPCEVDQLEYNFGASSICHKCFCSRTGAKCILRKLKVVAARLSRLTSRQSECMKYFHHLHLSGVLAIGLLCIFRPQATRADKPAIPYDITWQIDGDDSLVPLTRTTFILANTVRSDIDQADVII